MEEICAACITYEPSLIEYVDFQSITEPVWLLGRKYNVLDGNDFEKLHKDIRSILWFTYRKQFLPIGDTGLTSDSGWGCMHRCGQMLMGRALVLKYLERDWLWLPDVKDSTYLKILYQFNDKEEYHYSIHKIAKYGSILNKQVGQWFGPNTVVQVLKKITEEMEDDLVVHVAMDNMVIKSELKMLFRGNSQSKETTLRSRNTSPQRTCDNYSRPVLLSIPLRLGLSEITPVYFDKLKASFTLRQCLGIIGGKTNHASYFIGYVGEELIYLDPHTTQLHQSEMDDRSYHCEHPSRMRFSELDPSIALCFYCENEADFDNWCGEAQRCLLEPERDAIFEILDEKPKMLPYIDIDDLDDADFNCTGESERKFTSDDEFELLL